MVREGKIERRSAVLPSEPTAIPCALQVQDFPDQGEDVPLQHRVVQAVFAVKHPKVLRTVSLLEVGLAVDERVVPAEQSPSDFPLPGVHPPETLLLHLPELEIGRAHV